MYSLDHKDIFYHLNCSEPAHVLNVESDMLKCAFLCKKNLNSYERF